jgi:hypothetical protein
MYMPRLSALTMLSLAMIGRAADVCVSVSDPVNLPVPRAWVLVASLSTMETRLTTVTDFTGRACLKSVAEGSYSVEVGAPGFMSVRYYPVRIQPARDRTLSFRLPIGEIREGGIQEDAVLTGTFRSIDSPSPHVRICLLQRADGSVVSCTTADEMGQYALSVPPGLYVVEVTERGQKPIRRNIDLTRRGIHRKKLLDDQ